MRVRAGECESTHVRVHVCESVRVPRDRGVCEEKEACV
jgi:hypothetical protein